MPKTEVGFYCDEDGAAPVLDWLSELTSKNERAHMKCHEIIKRLELLGHELRRPTADLLQDGVYELRARVGRVRTIGFCTSFTVGMSLFWPAGLQRKGKFRRLISNEHSIEKQHLR